MKYEDIRAELDDLALEMATTARPLSQAHQVKQLEQLALLAQCACEAASGSANEAARVSSTVALLDRVRKMLAAAVLANQIRDDCRHR